jgi:hypothetical protein
MTARIKLAVFFMLIPLFSPTFPVQSAKSDSSVSLGVEVRAVVSVSFKNNFLTIQSNSQDTFLVLVYDEIAKNNVYLPTNSNPLLEANKTYTVISAP